MSAADCTDPAGRLEAGAPGDAAEAAVMLHLSMRGRVQGVGFRDTLCEVAEHLGLDGWVRNRRDGTVEALIRGPSQAADAMVRWSRRGPPAARVEHLDVRPATGPESATLQAGFRRLPTA